MTPFRFVARDSAGQVRRGTEPAESATAAIATLRGRGWSVVDVRPSVEQSLSLVQWWQRIRPSRWLPPRSVDVETGLRQLAIMLRGGMTLLSALRIAAEQARRSSLQRVWEDVAQRVQSGSNLASAMQKERCFSQLVIQLVRVGEQTGTLEAVFRRAADVLERRRSLLGNVLMALAYPTIVVVMAIGVTVFMMVNVFPKLQVFLQQLGRKLPAITQALMDFSTWVRVWGPQIGIVTAALLAGLLLVYLWAPGRLFIDRSILRVPLIGYILRLAATAMFARALGILIRSGVTLLEGLRTVEMLHRNRYLRQFLGLTRDLVLQGSSLSDSLRSAGVYMPMLAAMVSVGESTGTLDDVLDETAQFHEEQLQMMIRRLSIVIEPVIILIVGGIVGFVYIAFFMAMFAAAGPGGR